VVSWARRAGELGATGAVGGQAVRSGREEQVAGGGSCRGAGARRRPWWPGEARCGRDERGAGVVTRQAGRIELWR
jgi:hypothetical protein